MLAPAVQLLVIWFCAAPGVNHRRHMAIEGFPDCTQCHTEAERADKLWPARESHATCDAAECHAQDFGPAGYGKTKICTTCHLKKSRISAPLQPFPPPKGEREYYAEISHKTHMAKKVQTKLKDPCLDCHQINRETREVARPGHEQCQNCHGREAKVKMSDCAKCHAFRRDETGQPVPMGPRGLQNPCRVTEKFSHVSHRFDARRPDRPAVSCGTCHLGLAKAQTLAAIVPTHGRQTMLDACGRCHRPGQKTSEGRKLVTTIGDCTGCHTTACLIVGPAPSWHR